MRNVACMLHIECLLVAGEEAFEVVGFYLLSGYLYFYIRSYSSKSIDSKLCLEAGFVANRARGAQTVCSALGAN